LEYLRDSQDELVFPRLTSLSTRVLEDLDYTDDDEYDFPSWRIFSRCRFPQLLHLDICICHEHGEDFASALYQAIRSMPVLQHLHLEGWENIQLEDFVNKVTFPRWLQDGEQSYPTIYNYWTSSDATFRLCTH